VTTASASGKVILFGEHAVVYGRPAIAVPVTSLRAWAKVTDTRPGSGCIIEASDLGRQFPLAGAPADDPLALIVRLTLAELRQDQRPDWRIAVHSQLPIAGGLGSGAAVSTAIVRAMADHVGQPLPSAKVARLVFETERLYHGTPSGIDNTVVAYERPIYFVTGHPPELLHIGADLTLVIADTGVPSPTKIAVADVRKASQQDPAAINASFDAMDEVVDRARKALGEGDMSGLGRLLNENQRLLEELGVSSPLLDQLCAAARQAGAYGAKLSGAGRGGNLVALVPPANVTAVIAALRAAGAVGAMEARVAADSS
jgi:mevalonate kinase